jgi:hypothetical protein
MPLIQQLSRTLDETLPYFLLGDADLARTYAPGKWSVRYILLHLADAETVLFDRIRRSISEVRPVVWAFDQDAWAAHLDYERLPLDLANDVFSAVRRSLIWLAQEHYERNGDLEFVHSETGVRTLRMEFDKVAWHNEHHLAQIRSALGQ